jgi:hypothetical protein
MNFSTANESLFSSSETVLTLFLFATGLLLFLAGRALVSFLTDPRGPLGSHPLASPNFAAIGTGAGLTLLLTWALRFVGVYGFWPMIGCLSAVVLAGVAFRPGFRDLLFRPWRHAGWLLIVYLLLSGVFLFLFRPYEFPLKDTSMYLVQGFELFLPNRDPSEIFQFGAKISIPLLYSTHAIPAVFGLFSYPDHFFYFSLGEYLLNGFLGTTIPIGAYLLFRRFLPWWAALAAAILFCGTILDYKIWSLRGESLAWIVGFGFLIVQADLQAHVRRNGVDAPAFGAAALMAVLYFALCMTHGVTALIAALMSAGMAVPFAWHLFRQRKRRPLAPSLAVMGVFAVLTLALTLGFDATYSRNSQILEDNARPPAGEFDAAIEYDNAILNLPLETDAPRVLAAPPYVELAKLAQISALLPPANLFYPGIMRFNVREFPALALQKLEEISQPQRWAFAALFALCCVLYLRYPAKPERRDAPLFSAAASVYLLLILFALYMDLKSVSLFPLSAVRRTFPYQAFSYWTVVALALANVVALPAAAVRRDIAERRRALGWSEFEGRSVGSLTLGETAILLARLPLRKLAAARISVRGRARRSWEELRARSVAELDRGELITLLAVLPQRWIETAGVSFGRVWSDARARVDPPRASFPLERVAAACLIPAWLFYSINTGNGRPVSLEWLTLRIESCLNNDCSGRSAPPLEVSLTPLFEAMQVVRDHTNVGDWVFSNVPSESQFFLLTSGRHSLLDGGSIFQLYYVQKAAARRIKEISKFAETADPKYVAGYPFQLIVLYKSAALGSLVSYGDPPVPTDMSAFALSTQFEKLWENHYYAIYRRRSGQTAAAAPDPADARNPAEPNVK